MMDEDLTIIKVSRKTDGWATVRLSVASSIN